LKEINEVDKLLGFLTHSSFGVRMAAATYLLPIHENEAIKVLLEISRGLVYMHLRQKQQCQNGEKGILDYRLKC
jgi:hypothetical protein